MVWNAVSQVLRIKFMNNNWRQRWYNSYWNVQSVSTYFHFSFLLHQVTFLARRHTHGISKQTAIFDEWHCVTQSARIQTVEPFELALISCLRKENTIKKMGITFTCVGIAWTISCSFHLNFLEKCTFFLFGSTVRYNNKNNKNMIICVQHLLLVAQCAHRISPNWKPFVSIMESHYIVCQNIISPDYMRNETMSIFIFI